MLTKAISEVLGITELKFQILPTTEESIFGDEISPIDTLEGSCFRKKTTSPDYDLLSDKEQKSNIYNLM